MNLTLIFLEAEEVAGLSDTCDMEVGDDNRKISAKDE